MADAGPTFFPAIPLRQWQQLVPSLLPYAQQRLIDRAKREGKTKYSPPVERVVKEASKIAMLITKEIF